MAATASAHHMENFSAGQSFSLTKMSLPDSPTDSFTKNPLSFVSPESVSDKVSAAEKAVLAMGIPDNILQMVKAFHALQHGTDFTSAGQLFTAAEDLLNCPDEQARICKKLDEAELARKEERSNSKGLLQDKDAGITSEVSVSQSAEMQKVALVEAKPSVDDKAQLREKVRKLARENQRLRQRKMCSACREVDLASSGVTFLPCGHFITCEACSEKYDDCPACGKSIMGTVRTFLS